MDERPSLSCARSNIVDVSLHWVWPPQRRHQLDAKAPPNPPACRFGTRSVCVGGYSAALAFCNVSCRTQILGRMFRESRGLAPQDVSNQSIQGFVSAKTRSITAVALGFGASWEPDLQENNYPCVAFFEERFFTIPRYLEAAPTQPLRGVHHTVIYRVNGRMLYMRTSLTLIIQISGRRNASKNTQVHGWFRTDEVTSYVDTHSTLGHL